MRSESVGRFTLPSSLSPYLPWAASGTLFRLHSSAAVWNLTAGPQGGHLDASEAGNGERCLGICSAGLRDFWIWKLRWFWLGPVILGLCPDHMAGALGPLATGGCQWIRSIEPHPVSLWGDLIPAHSPAGRFCKFLSCRLRWFGASWVLMEFVPGQSTPVQGPQTPYRDLASLWVHQVQGKHGLSSMPCPLNAVLLSAVNTSLNFHESCTLPESLEMGIHMCTWLASEWRVHIFSFLT
jgi:hypothetical protein